MIEFHLQVSKLKEKYIHYFFLFLISISFLGCSSTKLSNAWDKTAHASYVAATDPLTWGSAVAAGTLYATYDDDITQHFMKNNLIDSEIDEPLRTLNSVMLYSSAVLVENDTTKEMAKRLATDFVGSAVARNTTNILNTIIKKDSPSKDRDSAIGSHHALDPFAGSALTRRNIDDMSIPLWSKYSLNTISYLSATGSAFTRVQEGGHSFADQLVSASIGNFIGLFFYEAFLGKDEFVEVSVYKNSFSLKTTWQF